MKRSDNDQRDPDQPDYMLDISSLNGGSKPAKPKTGETGIQSNGGRPYLSIHFKCCNAYLRIYPTADSSAYAGHCPKCARPVRIKIGPGGSQTRVFEAE